MFGAQQHYNIDGSLRTETNAEAAERVQPFNRRGSRWMRPPRPTTSKEEQLEAARKVVTMAGKGQSQPDNSAKDHDTRDGSQPSYEAAGWSEEADRILFGRGGEAPFRRGSPQFEEFRDFYTKFAAMRFKKIQAEASVANAAGQKHGVPLRDTVEDARHALVLFIDFQNKKKEQLRIKIEKDRNSLPIKALEQRIVETVTTNRVVLVAADTGAGKSTQVPQYLLAAGFDRIAVTQPRRIACMSLARRVSYESMNMYGSEIAYQVRFDGNKSEKTKILFLTEGVLLRQFSGDPRLSMYQVIVVDEVHERHMTGDFLLGTLKRLLSYREDVRIILMSATINAELFGEYFDAPVIEVPGRMYPVSIEYLPVDEEDRNLVDDRLFDERMKAEVRKSVATRSQKINAAPYLRILERIDQLVPPHERGDLLVFVSGLNEITLLAEELKAYSSNNRKWIVLSLHSSLSVTEQEKVFDIAPPGVRKCILSTNIAETSVTIDGVRFIIDSGKVKEMAFDAAANLSRLSEFWISQSSAKQRAGRAGRTGPGQCYRLYSKKEYERFNEFPVPEILRMPLEPLVLQIRAYNLGDPRTFDFIERPAESAISYSVQRLQDLAALDRNEEITSLGRILAVMPLDVVLAKMLVLASISDMVDSIVIVAAALSVQSPFLRIPENQKHTLENRRSLFSKHGDPFTLHNVFTEWLRIKAERGESSSKWCRRFGLEEQRLYEMMKLKSQFEGILSDVLKMSVGSRLSNARKRKGSFDDIGVSGPHRAAKKLDWKDPAAQRRREQRRLLEQQKLLLNSGKRKMLRLEEEDEAFGSDTEIGPSADIADMSIDALEFSLRHDGVGALTPAADVGSLCERDINILKLIICSGLYPHQAVPDDTNHTRDVREQLFHTRSKRFVTMHPTSIFYDKPELVYPQTQENIRSPMEGQRETLATLHTRSYVTEMLCYVELLETNKPYLINVLRVPALGACLLFAKSIDVSPDVKHFVIDNWLHLNFADAAMAGSILVFASFLRIAWARIVALKLEKVSHRLPVPAVDHAEETEHAPIIGTSMRDVQAATTGARTTMPTKSDWKDLDFVPTALQRVRYEWEDGVLLGGIGPFADLAAEDVSAKLGDFLDLPTTFTVERLKTQDIPRMFGYDPYATENNPSAAVPLTPNIRYFVPTPKTLTRKIRARVALPCGRHALDVSELSRSSPSAANPSSSPPTSSTTSQAPLITEECSIESSSIPSSGVARQPMVCAHCRKSFVFTPVELLRHRKSCGG
ncbi:putative ATP-dependent RNA helicase DHX34 [Powellomyces hirtus]|nr:putative ATP-dependent RNA helicase DHX34 [Powellomyces hirtus]